ncbi:MAG: hypothetical protein BWY91_02527 [bacterium ADurb.BinA028]|nr:MAG: hypothetical protein BWY91_02527 [bacterium ADurb.BinA028]
MGRPRSSRLSPRPASVVAIRASTSHTPRRSATANAWSYAAAADPASGAAGAAARASAARLSDLSALRTGATADSTASAMVSSGSKGGSWCRSPRVALPPRVVAVTAPPVGASRPARQRNSVDLPEPFSPMRPTRSPAETVNVTSVSSGREVGEPAYEKDSPSTRRWVEVLMGPRRRSGHPRRARRPQRGADHDSTEHEADATRIGPRAASEFPVPRG